MNISIIIPTRNRSALLLRCLQSLLPQLQDGDEVILVDNGDSYQTKLIVSTFLQQYPIIYIHERRKGSSYARNTGFRKTKGEGIAFLDDDCIVSQQWLAEIRRLLEGAKKRNTISLFQGKIIYKFPSDSLRKSLFILQHQYDWTTIRKSKKWESSRALDLINAGNFFTLRRIFHHTNYLFDSRTFPYIGEERDLAYRLQLQGVSIEYTPSVSVTHVSLPLPLRTYLLTWLQYGRAHGILEKRYLAKREIRSLFSSGKERNVFKKTNSFTSMVIKHFHGKPLLQIRSLGLLYAREFLYSMARLIYRYV